MMHVIEQAEPAIFEERVRKPGAEFLADYPHPTTKLWNTHSYWRRILPELHTLYGGICAYSCHWIPYDTGADTVEHFKEKKNFPNEAYNWTNYRLVCSTLNGRKGIRTVLDPFTLNDGVFVMDFPSLLLRPADDVLEPLRTEVANTINFLRLNDQGTCWKARERYVKCYCRGFITYEFLQMEAPFVAKEISRAGRIGTLNEIMLY